MKKLTTQKSNYITDRLMELMGTEVGKEYTDELLIAMLCIQINELEGELATGREITKMSSICDQCATVGCIFQAGIKREKCAFYKNKDDLFCGGAKIKSMAAGIKKFIEHYKDDVPESALQYEAGKVIDDEYDFHIGWEQYGAHETFSVGQPVYDEHGNIMGYLGIGLYSNLDYSTDESIRIPVAYWRICLPTQHCKVGKKVFTYWQNRKRAESEDE